MSRAVELVIGLEVHVRLDTGGKLFCRCRLPIDTTRLTPNSSICGVCIGHPGAMPELQPEAVVYGLALAQALGAPLDDLRVPSRFERKHYFYWDLPKNYQVTQIAYPFCHRGRVRVEPGDGGEPFEINLTRIHLEEDAARKQEDAHEIRVDFNRSGSVLAEIVTEPEFRSPEQVGDFLRHLQQTLRWHRLGSGLPEHGDFRCDVNLSVRWEGDELPDWKVEVKNLARLDGVVEVIRSDGVRLGRMLRAGESFRQETRQWNAELRTTERMRGKETASQYWYYVEPDLLSLQVSDQSLDTGREMLRQPVGDAVAALRQAGFSADEIHTIVFEPDVGYPVFYAVSRGLPLAEARALSDLLRSTAAVPVGAEAGDPEMNWRQSFAARWARLKPNLDAVVQGVADGVLASRHLRELVGSDALVEGEWSSAKELLMAHGLAAAGGDDLEAAVTALLEELRGEHPEEHARWLAAEDPVQKQKIANFFQGRVMRKLPRGSDGRRVRDILAAYPDSAG